MLNPPELTLTFLDGNNQSFSSTTYSPLSVELYDLPKVSFQYLTFRINIKKIMLIYINSFEESTVLHLVTQVVDLEFPGNSIPMLFTFLFKEKSINVACLLK